MEKSRIYFKSCEDMSEIENESIQLMVTSPPYWKLKDYLVSNQIGYNERYYKYISRLLRVWNEVFRIVKKDGISIININTKLGRFNQKSPNKSLIQIQNDFIKQMESLGFILKDILIWHKSSGIPSKNNFSDHFEYFLIFSKNNLFKLNKEVENYFDYKLNLINYPVNIWNINKKAGNLARKHMTHPAIFPVEFIERLIKIFTSEGDVVLDPFIGSGTTLIASILNNRNCVGYELNSKEYLELIKFRLMDYNVPAGKVKFFTQNQIILNNTL